MRYGTPTVADVVADARKHGLRVPDCWTHVETPEATGMLCWAVHGWLVEMRYAHGLDEDLACSPHNTNAHRPWQGLRLDTLLHALEQHWDTDDLCAALILNLSPADCAPLDRARTRTELAAGWQAKVEFRQTLRMLLALQGTGLRRTDLLTA